MSHEHRKQHPFPPRIIRFRNAPTYLGTGRNRFNVELPPCLTKLPIGTQGIGFDRLELDARADDSIARNWRPARKGASASPASFSEMESGMSTNASAGDHAVIWPVWGSAGISVLQLCYGPDFIGPRRIAAIHKNP